MSLNTSFERNQANNLQNNGQQDNDTKVNQDCNDKEVLTELIASQSSSIQNLEILVNKSKKRSAWWKVIVYFIFKYIYYYFGYLFLFLHLPTFAKRRIAPKKKFYFWVIFHMLAFIYCYTLPFVFIIVTFITRNDTFSMYVNTVFFVHVNLLIINKIFKEKTDDIAKVFNFFDPNFSWFAWLHTSLSVVQQKMNEKKMDMEFFVVSYTSIGKNQQNLYQPLLIEKFADVNMPMNPIPLMHEVLQFKESEANIYRDVEHIVKWVSFIGVTFRLTFLFIALQTHFSWEMPYQIWLSLGIFGTIYFEFVFSRNLDLIGQIVCLKRLKKLIKLDSSSDTITLINVCCPVTIMSWTKIVKFIQQASLDFIKREDLLISLYILWYLVLLIVIILDRVYKFNDSILAYDLLWIYSIDILTLCYVIIVRLFYGTKLNRELLKMTTKLSEINKYIEDLGGHMNPIIRMDPQNIKFDKYKIILEYIQKYTNDSVLSYEQIMDHFSRLKRTYSICLQEFVTINSMYIYKFLAVIPCHERFFYSIVISLITAGATTFFSQLWRQF